MKLKTSFKCFHYNKHTPSHTTPHHITQCNMIYKIVIVRLVRSVKCDTALWCFSFVLLAYTYILYRSYVVLAKNEAMTFLVIIFVATNERWEIESRVERTRVEPLNRTLTQKSRGNRHFVKLYHFLIRCPVWPMAVISYNSTV